MLDSPCCNYTSDIDPIVFPEVSLHAAYVPLQQLHRLPQFALLAEHFSYQFLLSVQHLVQLLRDLLLPHVRTLLELLHQKSS